MTSQMPAVLISAEKIAARVVELAHRITLDYGQMRAGNLLLVGVLKGAFMFLADLARRIDIPHSVDFIAVSSYEDQTVSSGAVRLVMDLSQDIAGSHILIVEDILDTGYTLDYLLKNLAARQPASLKTCILLRKKARIQKQIPVDYVGFDIDNVYVVGYGLDHAGLYRTLPYLGVLAPTERAES